MIYDFRFREEVARHDYDLKKFKERGALVNMSEEKDIRTGQQNSAIHLFCHKGATKLNETGQTFTMVVDGFEVELQYSMTLFKNKIWRPIQMALFDKESTTELTRKEVSEVAKPIIAMLAKMDINLPFPSKKDK